MSGALSVEWMGDYSANSFLDALIGHYCLYRMVRIMTADEGSQIKCEGCKAALEAEQTNRQDVD